MQTQSMGTLMYPHRRKPKQQKEGNRKSKSKKQSKYQKQQNRMFWRHAIHKLGPAFGSGSGVGSDFVDLQVPPASSMSCMRDDNNLLMSTCLPYDFRKPL